MDRTTEICTVMKGQYVRVGHAKVSFFYTVVFVGGIFCSIVSAIIIALTDRECEYFLYFMIPLGFTVFLILTLFCDHEIHKRPVFVLFVGLYFLKLVITPTISAFGDWYTLSKGVGYREYLSDAILLTVWEPLFVGSVLAVYTRCKRRVQLKCNFGKDFGIPLDGADFLIAVGTIFVTAVFLYYPPLRVRMSWLLTIGTNQDVTPVVRSWRNFFVSNGREIPLGIIDTLMMKVFYVIRVLFPVMLIEKIYHKNWKWKKKAFLSLFIVLLAAQVTTEANGETVLFAAAAVLLLFMLYPKLKGKYGGIIIVLGIFTAGILFMLKVKGSGGYGSSQSDVSIMQSLSATMNAYMNGPINLAVAIKAKENYNIIMGIEEVLGGLPFLNRFFRGYQTSTIFNEVFWGFKGRTDQLLPALGQGYMYFGSVLAPLLQFFFIVWGLGFEKISENARSIKVKGYFMFLAIVTIWTIGNNLSHVMGFMLRYLPGIIILYFKRFRIKIKS